MTRPNKSPGWCVMRCAWPPPNFSTRVSVSVLVLAWSVGMVCWPSTAAAALVAALILGLATQFVAGLAALIIGVAVLGVGGVFALVGKKQVQRVGPAGARGGDGERQN